MNAAQHERLGPCPIGHDNSRDCRCPCRQCPNRDPYPNSGDPTEAEITRRIRAEITHRIRESGYFRREPARVDHGRIQIPHHNETVGVPLYPVIPDNLRANDRTVVPPITKEHSYVMAALSGFVGEFAGSESWRRFPNNPQAHHSLTIALGQRPCTEQIPWNTSVANWVDPCPRDRRGLGDEPARPGNQRGPSWPCNETRCQQEDPGVKIQRYDHNQEPIDSDDEDFEDDYRDTNEDSPPGDPETHNNNRWVCRYHKRDAEGFWEHENLIEAHRVPTCNHCKTEHQGKYPFGHNSCTCANLLSRWQCRRCFEKKVRTIQTHFRQRVGAHYTGEADFDMIASNTNSADPNRPDLGPGLGTYHWNAGAGQGWRQVRRMLIAQHPCIGLGLSRYCGQKRVANQTLVMHCRSCGGVVVKPVTTRTSRIGTRAGRLVRRRRPASPLRELVFPRGTRGARGNRSGVSRDLGANSANAPGTTGTLVVTAVAVPGTVGPPLATGAAAPATGGAVIATGPTAAGTAGTIVVTGANAPGTTAVTVATGTTGHGTAGATVITGVNAPGAAATIVGTSANATGTAPAPIATGATAPPAAP